jgi:hypothetical protein
MTMTRDEEFSTFLAGWKFARQKCIDKIKEYSAGWLPNGPSLAAANAIIQQLEAIPLPKSEDDINVSN